MKMNITIKNQMRNEEIVEIEICNGNWKYWDNYMKTNQKESLTINTFNKAHYLAYPVKDELQYGLNKELYEETGEIEYQHTSVRMYTTLLEYLNCRINNVKEDRNIFTEQNFECVLFDDAGRVSDRTLEEDVVFHSEERMLFEKGLKKITVTIEIIE